MKEKHTSKKQSSGIAGRVLTAAVFSLLLFLSLALIWAGQNFGSVGMDEILFTLNMPLDGSGSGLIQDFICWAVIPSLLVLILSLVWAVWSGKRKKHSEESQKRYKKSVWLVGGAWALVLLLITNWNFGVMGFLYNQFNQSELIEQEYVDPNTVQLKFPEKKRNLIYLFLESGESSTQDKANGGLFDVNYTPEMTEIAKENVSFSHSDLIEGAAVAPACGWTMAGMVAQFAGLPLKLYKYDDRNVDNSMSQYSQFLPGVTNLGDILEQEGYNNYFMLGSDVTFAGQDHYMKQHGNYEIFDYCSAIREKKIPKDYFVWWGFEDVKLFEYAKEKITELSKQEEPFNFCFITIDTHGPDGYRCNKCKNEHPEQYGNVWSCSSRQIGEFIDWVKQQPFYEDTTIVICGDHCSMDPNFYKDYPYDKHRGETVRKVYNAILNPAGEPKQEHNRKFTTLDMFPTTLAAMGVEIEGERLGIGTNLFSDTPTLAEEYGYESLFKELNRKSSFYNEKFLYAQ